MIHSKCSFTNQNRSPNAKVQKFQTDLVLSWWLKETAIFIEVMIWRKSDETKWGRSYIQHSLFQDWSTVAFKIYSHVSTSSSWPGIIEWLSRAWTLAASPFLKAESEPQLWVSSQGADSSSSSSITQLFDCSSSRELIGAAKHTRVNILDLKILQVFFKNRGKFQFF